MWTELGAWPPNAKTNARERSPPAPAEVQTRDARIRRLIALRRHRKAERTRGPGSEKEAGAHWRPSVGDARGGGTSSQRSAALGRPHLGTRRVGAADQAQADPIPPPGYRAHVISAQSSAIALSHAAIIANSAASRWASTCPRVR